MGNLKYPTGIRPVASGIQIRFTWNKQRYEPIWPYPSTAKNIQAAERILLDLKFRAKAGILTLEYLAEIFPQYKHSTPPDNHVSHLFGAMAQTYLNTANVSENTRIQYRQILNRYWMPHFHNTDVRDIPPALIRKKVSEVEWSSNRLRNVAITPLRNVLEMCVDDGILERNPAEVIKNLRNKKPEVDPFTPEERELILNYMNRTYKGSYRIYYLYFKFAFWTGMRISEIVALKWGDVDFIANKVAVNKSVVRGRERDTTKTNVHRFVLLNDEALDALKEMKQFSFLQGDRIFVSPKHGKPWRGSNAPMKVLNQVFRKLGIRHRPAYNTRHTYATFCIMAGADPSFTAGQLGHSVRTLFSTYAKWIDGEADALEMAKIGKKLGKLKQDSIQLTDSKLFS